MNEKLDFRAHHFACSVGIDYDIALLVTKRISRKMKITMPNNEVLKGNSAVYKILFKLYDLKGFGKNLNYPPRLTSSEERMYLEDFTAKNNLDINSVNEISELYVRHKIYDIVSCVFPKEIDVKTLTKSELEALVGWLFSKTLLPLSF